MIEVKNLPPALLKDGRFCCWRYEDRDGKLTKVPYNPKTGGRAQSTNPATFATLETTLKAVERGRYDGLGVGIFGNVGAVDIDHCIDDNGELSPLAFDVMDTIKGYTEYSPSGHGLRILFKAAGFQYDKARYYINNQKLGLEIYIAGCTNKFVTVTGNALTPGLEIEEHGEQLAAVLEKYMVRTKMKKTTPPSASSGPVELDDVALIEKAKKGRNGEQFAALWAGDTSSYQSQSEADMALCNWLAWWTNKDAARMDRLFRSSGLMREKWDRRQSGSTYGAITIQEAIASCSGGYDPQTYFKRTEESVAANRCNHDIKSSQKNVKAKMAPQKQKLLSSAIENSKKQISLLASEMQKTGSSEIVEKDADAYQSLTRTLSRTVSQLKGYENQLNDLATQSEAARASIQNSSGAAVELSNEFQQAERNADDLEETLGRISDAARSALDGFQQAENGAESLEDDLQDVADAADKAEKELNDVGNSTGSAGDGFTVAKGAAATFAGTLLTEVVDAALQVAEAIWDMDEATEEYREAMGRLNTAFETAGFNAEIADEAYEGFFKILGDTGQATDAAQLLAQLATNEEDVAKWVEIAAGVYGKFGDNLPIESLIEAANETAKTGEVTGALADALNWVGISEEEVSEQLANISTETDRARYLMDLLSKAYGDAAESFYENNQEITGAREAQLALDESLGVLGQSVADLKAALVDTFGPALGDLAKGAAGFIDGIANAVSGLGDGFDWLGGKVKDFFALLGGKTGFSGSRGSGFGGGSSRINNAPQVATMSVSDVGNFSDGISTTASKQAAIPEIASFLRTKSRDAVISDIANWIPSAVRRVESMNSMMVPASVSASVPRSQSEQTESGSSRAGGGEQRVKLDIGFYPREAAKFLRPYMRGEDKRTGEDLVD